MFGVSRIPTHCLMVGLVTCLLNASGLFQESAIATHAKVHWKQDDHCIALIPVETWFYQADRRYLQLHSLEQDEIFPKCKY